MKILKYTILLLLLLNLPPFGLTNFGIVAGGILSALLYFGIFLYFFINDKKKPPFAFIILGISYYLISGLNYTGELGIYLLDALKFFLFISLIVELCKNTNQQELLIILLLGALSIIINVVAFPNDYGRYSGFYINPNKAGLLCLFGYSFTFKVKKNALKLICQFLFIIAGLLTFSRSFIITLLLISVLSVISNKKNILVLIVGTVAMVLILNITSFQLNTQRFNALKSVFSDEVDTEAISKNSRNETWSLYTDVILENPIIGNGYRSMQGKNADTVGVKAGVHNSYLMALGEAGVIPFLMLIIIYLALLIRSIKHFSTHPEYLYLAIILFNLLLVSHNYFDYIIVLFISIWLYIRVNDKDDSFPLNPV